MRIIPSEIKISIFHSYLLGAIAPRPICFASTVDAEGNPNLSPFSFFNVFGSKPPILVFSPARRVRDNSIKHTLENALQTKEVVINVVNYAMVQQMSLASCEYPKGVDEFVKSGFTKIASEFIKPFRVKESPAQFECKVINVIETGKEGGAGNLIVCEVICMHLNDDVLDEKGLISPHKIDLVARMGGDYYCRASGEAVFEVPKPNMSLGIGVDALPDSIKNSKVLTGNYLGLLGNYNQIPPFSVEFEDENIKAILETSKESSVDSTNFRLHQYAKELMDKGYLDQAWQILLRSR